MRAVKKQDLPTKNFKSTDVGSQIQKNILDGEFLI